MHLSGNLVSHTSPYNPWLVPHKRSRLRPRPYRLVMSRWFTNPLKELLGFVRIHLAEWFHSYQVLRYSVTSSPHMLKIWIWVWSTLVLSRVSPCRFQNCKPRNILRGSGQVTLGKLRIKKSALDAFRLPIDVAEGSCHYHYRRGTLANMEAQATWESFPCPCIGSI